MNGNGLVQLSLLEGRREKELGHGHTVIPSTVGMLYYQSSPSALIPLAFDGTQILEYPPLQHNWRKDNWLKSGLDPVLILTNNVAWWEFAGSTLLLYIDTPKRNENATLILSLLCDMDKTSPCTLCPLGQLDVGHACTRQNERGRAPSIEKIGHQL